MNFRKNLPCRVLLAVGCLSVGLPAGAAEPKLACTLQTEHVRWTIGVDGRSLGWVDLGDQQDYCPASHPPVATVKKAGKYHAATAAELKDGLLELQRRLLEPYLVSAVATDVRLQRGGDRLVVRETRIWGSLLVPIGAMDPRASRHSWRR